MEILVTGGAGFIGSAVIRYLVRETSDEVVNLDALTYAGNLDSLAEVADSPCYCFERADICDQAAVCTVLRQPARNLHFRMLTDKIRLRMLRELEKDPGLSQRDLARALGVSLGKTNYCLRALVEKGLVKVENFRKSGNKLAYAYQLTPQGISDKARITRKYLQIKLREYKALESETKILRKEVTGTSSAGQVS